MKNIGIIITLLFLISCKPDNMPPYHVSHKLDKPIPFADGTITTVNGISFSKDGKTLFISKNLDRKFDNGRTYAGIFFCNFKEGKWSKPQPLPLEIDAYHPVLSEDNNRVYFNSRSHPDSANKSIPHNIWYISKNAYGWSIPEMVEGVNSPSYDSYPSIAKNGNLYFNSDREGGKGSMDFYVSYFKNGQYQIPVNLKILNSEDVENDLVVDPLERFIIFNRYIHETKSIDLFISSNKNGQWSQPQKIDQVNDPKAWELTPTLSPDGNYFFYELNSKIMQIDLSVLLDNK